MFLAGFIQISQDFFWFFDRLPNGEREGEVIPRDIQEKLDKIKENFHDLEGTIRQQRLYLNSLSAPLVSKTAAETERESLAERE